MVFPVSLDTLNQLISDKTHTYQYDSHFNRLQKDDDSYQIDSLNRIHSTKNNTYTYDRNGNLLTKQSSLDFVQYTYDALDRLIAIEEPHHTRYTYIYDSFHRRLSKTVYKWRRHQWVHQTTQYFLYDGENEIGSTDTQGTIHELRILGQGRGAEISAAIAIELDNEVYAPIYDLCGNVAELISLTTGQVVQTYTYTPFGEETISYSPQLIENPWRFCSKRTEERFQLVFFGRRYYQPHLGRWLNPDPDGFTDSLNLYAYLLNAPLTHLDLYGLAEEALNSIPYSQNELIPVSASYTQHFYHKPGTHSNLDHTDDRPRGRIIFTNGINNTYDDFTDSVDYISNLSGGYPASGLYFPTKGIPKDVVRALRSRYGTRRTATVHYLYEFIIDNLKFVGPKGALLFIAHSLGGENLNQAIRLLTKEQRRQITLLPIAPARLFSRRLGDVTNYARWSDIVVVSQFISVIKGLIQGNLKFVPRAKGATFLFDHPFQSPSYKPILEKNTKDFTSTYNCRVESWKN